MKRYVIIAGVNGAGKIAVSKINHYFEIGESFNQESTLCGRSIIKNIKRAKNVRISHRTALCRSGLSRYS